jgi:hypothetical protein
MVKMAEQQNPKPEREIDVERELVHETFQADAGGRLELEKKILAVAFLLDSEDGDLDRDIAVGLAAILRGAAKEIAMLRRRLRRVDASE